MQAVNTYSHRALMQVNEDSKESESDNYGVILLLIFPILAMVVYTINVCMQEKAHDLLNQSFKNWTPHSKMSFRPFYEQDGLKRTPLQIAIQVNNFSLVRHILQNPDLRRFQKDVNQNSELHYAAEQDDMSILEAVAQATPVKTIPVNRRQKTPLHRAAERAKKTHNSAPLLFLLPRFKFKDQLLQDKDGNTFLHSYVLDPGRQKFSSAYSFPEDLSGQRAFVASLAKHLNPKIFEIENKQQMSMLTVKPDERSPE